jgi:hypothetical protein
MCAANTHATASIRCACSCVREHARVCVGAGGRTGLCNLLESLWTLTLTRLGLDPQLAQANPVADEHIRAEDQGPVQGPHKRQQ